MKRKLLSLFLAMAMLFGTFALMACEKETESTLPSESVPTSSSNQESSQEPSSSEEESKDPADIIDPDAPENETLSIFVDGATDYVVVYDKDDTALGEIVEEFVSHISEKYNVMLSVNDDDDIEQTHEIIFGNVRENASFVVNKLYEVNDFAISVCGDDLVLYATGELLYDYMLEKAKELFNGRTDIEPERSYIYHTSANAEDNYATYLSEKNAGLSHEALLELFEARTYTATDKTSLNYRIYFPSNYDSSKSYPVVLILHGAGERGSDNSAQLKTYVPTLFSQKDSPYREAIVICPQCPGGQQWVDTPWAEGNYSTAEVAESNELRAVYELLLSVKNEYSTDESRYYITGLSMGGFGTWDMIMRHTELFAGAIPICGGADTEMAEKLISLPIYTFHGNKDTTVPITGTNDMVNAIKKACEEAGVDSVLNYVILNAQHLIWDTVASNKTYTKWLFEQIKK